MVALAYLPGSEINKANPQNKTHHLLMFWAPFFILHLGGQDTITALSVEDNELWSRQLLTLLSQVALAMYNYFSSNLHVGELWPPAALMFAVAIFKYGERILSLQRASVSALRSSMITKHDPGLNYAKIMREYTSSNASGLVAEIKVEVLEHKVEAPSGPPSPKEYAEVVCKAYKFFKIFKRLFVDLTLSYKKWDESQKYFWGLNFNDAYKLIEIELSWMYEILHSKGSVIYSYTRYGRHYGWLSRVITLVINTVVFYLFAISDHTGYGWFERNLTYVLLVGAVSFEIIALVIMLLSLWTYAAMRETHFMDGLSNYLFSIQERWIRPRKETRWSDKMAQYNLITYSLEDRPCFSNSIMEFFGIKETWDHYQYTTCVTVNEYLKESVFRELKNKMYNIDDTDSYRRFADHRGQWALQRKGYYQEFGWSVEAEFDESILIWHIATNLLFHHKDKRQQKPQPKPEKEAELKWEREREISQHISNYMLFLLIVQPFMMPAGIGEIRFGDTCAQATNFLQTLGDIEKGLKKAEAVAKILDVNKDYEPVLIKGNSNKSVLFKGCKLAVDLKKEFTLDEEESEPDWNKLWRLISAVWVEMLCYAASKCSGQFHAKQLSKGGELLTIVWFLMAHMGMAEQYRIEESIAHAMLFVSK